MQTTVLMIIPLIGIALSPSLRAQETPTAQPGGDLRALADEASKQEKAADEAHQRARAAAMLYLQAADAHCREMLAGDPDYSSAAATADIGKRQLSEARASGDSAKAAEASSRYNQAIAKVHEMEERMMSADQDVVEARAIVARLDNSGHRPAITAQNSPASKTPGPPFKQHAQIEVGMTKAELLGFMHKRSSAFRTVADSTSKDAGVESEEMRIEVLVRRDVVVGQHKDTFGGWHDTIEPRYETAGWIRVVITNGVVTEADADAGRY